MNDSGSWTKDYRCYEHLRVVFDMNDPGSWAQGFKCYEQFKAINDMS